jgi:hypothetical protein
MRTQRPHLLGAADDRAEREVGCGRCGWVVSPRPPGTGDLLARGEVARADDGAVVDRVADDDVEARLGRRGADAAGPAHVEVLLRDLGAPEDVLLGRHALDRVERRLVVPREMGVRLDHPRHQEGAGAVDDARAADRRARTPLALRTTRAILSPWTSTSPMNGASPPPSKMRTLV